MADELAKQGTTTIKITNLPHANQITKEYLREKVYQTWTDRWVADPTCRQTKQFFPHPDKIKAKKTLKLALSQLSILIQITTGHNALAYHANKINPEIYPLCSPCEEDYETFYHFIIDCPRLRITRDACNLGQFVGYSWEPECLLEFARTPVIETLLSRS